MNKRGFIFTFISVTLISVILLAFLMQYTSRTSVEIERTNTEVETMNSFVKSLNEDYLPRAVIVSGNQAILALLNCMDPNFPCVEGIENILNENNGYLPSEEEELMHYIKNAIVDGEFEAGLGGGADGPDLDLMTVDEVSYDLANVINEVVILAETTGINLDITSEIDGNPFRNQRMDIDQVDPFHIKVTITLDYSVSNQDGSISWDFVEKDIEAFIPLYNFRDPIYMIDGNINLLTEETPYPLDGDNSVVNNIEDHASKHYFLGCDQSPSFLMRMVGDITPHEQGIESLKAIQNEHETAVGFKNIFGDHENLEEIGDTGYYVNDIDGERLSCY